MDEALARRLDRIVLLLALIGTALVVLLASAVDVDFRSGLGFAIVLIVAAIGVTALLSVVGDASG